MTISELQEHWDQFCHLLNNLPTKEDDRLNHMIEEYTEQNIKLIDNIICESFKHIKKLYSTSNTQEMICARAQFANEMSKKLSLSTRCFLDASLDQITDYNEWLKAHCDLATD